MEIKKLEDEIFCLNYELKTLSDVLTAGKLERWLPGFTDLMTDFDHTQRYQWVVDFVRGKTVLDIACGSGKGSYMMATEGKARQVLGCDIENDAVKYASIKYKASNLEYKVQDATTLKENIRFDAAVSFETIEHINETNLYLNAIHSQLNENALFIVSTPLSEYEINTSPKNPYHVIEWGFEKFQKVVSDKFVIEKVFLQLHDETPYSFIEHRFKKILFKKPNYKNTKIIEFSSKIPIKKLGKQLTGYQILVCRKK